MQLREVVKRVKRAITVVYASPLRCKRSKFAQGARMLEEKNRAKPQSREDRKEDTDEPILGHVGRISNPSGETATIQIRLDPDGLEIRPTPSAQDARRKEASFSEQSAPFAA